MLSNTVYLADKGLSVMVNTSDFVAISTYTLGCEIDLSLVKYDQDKPILAHSKSFTMEVQVDCNNKTNYRHIKMKSFLFSWQVTNTQLLSK